MMLTCTTYKIPCPFMKTFTAGKSLHYRCIVSSVKGGIGNCDHWLTCQFRTGEKAASECPTFGSEFCILAKVWKEQGDPQSVPKERSGRVIEREEEEE